MIALRGETDQHICFDVEPDLCFVSDWTYDSSMVCLPEKIHVVVIVSDEDETLEEKRLVTPIGVRPETEVCNLRRRCLSVMCAFNI